MVAPMNNSPLALPVCYLNGEFVPAQEARISPFDRGFIFGGWLSTSQFIALILGPAAIALWFVRRQNAQAR